MTKETLRMQFLSGVITESEYKTKLEEGKELERDIKTFEDKIKTFEKELENAKKKIAKEKSKKNPNQETIERYLEDVEFVTDELKKDRQALKSYQKELKSKKESLNEHYVAGGIVGVGAINNPFEGRKKTDYEMAFEHFLGERYLNKFENREQDLEEGKEVEEPSLYEEELEENIFQGEDVMPKFRAGVLKQLIAYAEKEGSSKESIDDLKTALAKIEAEIEAEKNKKPLPR
jgi:DNA repair exonuclease SbcCD ATPase subunit